MEKYYKFCFITIGFLIYIYIYIFYLMTFVLDDSSLLSDQPFIIRLRD